MEKHHSIQQIANGLNAAAQLQKIHKDRRVDSLERSDRQQYVSILSEMLGVLCEYSPEKYKDTFGNSLDRTTQFCDTYRTLKQHLRTSPSNNRGGPEFINMLLLLKPATTSRHQYFIEKIAKIYRLIKE